MDYQAPDPTIAKLEMPWKSCGVDIWGSFNGILLVVGVVPPIRDVLSMPPFYDDGPSTVHVFSSKLSSWKSMGDFDSRCGFYYGTSRSVLNVSPRWVTRGITDIDGYYFHIVCFDVMEEKFKDVPTPLYEVGCNFFTVGVLDECLCADGEVVLRLKLEASVPSKKKKLEESLKLVICNPKQKTKRIGMPQDWRGFDVALYVESLVSPLSCNNYQPPDHTVTELKSPPCKKYVEIVGSFNGIVLLQMDNAELCLWNPSAKMYQKFSPPAGVNRFVRVKYGLCHDSVSDDFNSRLTDGRSAVHVFTSKLSSWKRIGDFGCFIIKALPRAVLNGAPHWFAGGEFYFSYIRLLCYRKDGEVVMKLDSEKLVIYNPKQNRYKRIEIPPDCKWFDAAYYMESLVSPRLIVVPQNNLIVIPENNLIVVPENNRGHESSKSFYSMDYQVPDPTIAKLEMPWKSCDDVEIWGSFNGVLLVSIDEELRLWNPSIGMYQKISPPGRSSSTIVYGLGYDSINDDFKVVGVVPPIRDSMPPCGPSTVHVFSSKLSSWKSIGDCDYHCVDFNRTARNMPRNVRGALFSEYYELQCFAMDGEVVLGLQLEKSRSVPFKKKKLEESLKLVIYNPKQKTKRIGMPQDWKLFEVTVYVESLVSPHGCNSTRRHC
ncbi:hypothetical protein RHSIM_Rhsim04G0210600 [Rhododendron simsii]|uniref:F-box associated beta-propeller type 3 domain-containing protein n=1 Tax=Rhododendron simsii TaxID=118357 RepID=A0A834HDC7_RHOSS|nr:hypothetical protein RHSIM_Rhsim04G0210600 [Rhododendron simsii]